MNLPDALQSRIRRYLDGVRAALGDRPPALRDAIAADLERQVVEALHQRAAGRAPTEADLDAVLEDMDPAQAFATPPAEPAPARGGRGRWFWLAVAFLCVNAWGVWRASGGARPGAVWVRDFLPGPEAHVEGAAPLRWRFSAPMAAAAEIGRPPAETPVRFNPPVAGRFVWKSDRELTFTPDEPWPLCRAFEATLDEALADRRGRPISGERSFTVYSAPLNVLLVEQAGASEDGATLRLVFNAAPSRAALARGLTIRRVNEDRPLPYRFVGDTVAREVLLTVVSPPAAELEIAVEEGILPQTGTLGLARPVSLRLSLSPRLALTRLEPRTPSFGAPSLAAYFTGTLDPAQAAEFIAIDPKLPFRLAPLETWRGGGVTIEADFLPGAVYTIRFRQGLRATHGAALESEIARSVNFPDRPPSLSFGADGSYLSPGGALLVPLSTVNIAECSVTLSRILPDNLVFFAMRQSGRYDHSYGYGLNAAAEKLTEPIATRTLAVVAKANEIALRRVDLRDWLPDGAGGAYQLVARNPVAGESRKLIVVTDLGLSAKRDRGGVFVWATSLREGRPIAGARVAVFAENNRELATGDTGDDGAVHLECRTDDPDAPPFLVVARRGTDVSYVKLDGESAAPAGPPGDRPYLAAGHEAYVFTDRGIFRPGEVLRVKAVVRDRAQAAPESFPVELRVYRPDGRAHRRWTAMLNEYGTAEWSEPWPDYAPLGRYRITLSTPDAETPMGETSVLLEEYAPPQIAVELRAAEDRFPTGAPVEFGVAARHLFGRPASGLAARAAGSIEAAPFAPAGWPGWRFGDAEKRFSEVYRDLGRGVLDETGAARWRLPLAGDWRPPAALRAMLSATVIENSGRAVTAWAARHVDPYPFYIGLRPAYGGGSVESGVEQTVAVAAVAPNGESYGAVAKLQAEWFRVEWTTLLRRRDDGQFGYETVRTLSPRGASEIALSGGRGEARFTPDRAGEYVLIVRDPESGASSSLPLYAADRGDRWVGWAMERPDRVEITLDRESYRPGESAKVTVKSPFSGIALLTIESDRVLTHRVLPIAGNTAEFELPVTESWRPNVYVVVSIVRPVVPAAVWTAHRATGAAALRVDAPDRRLAVEIAAPTYLRPQTRLEATVRARDAAGAPAADAEVVLAAVDEGICSLTDFQSPDPAAWFQARRRLGVALFDVYGDLLPLMDDRAGGAASHPPGGEGAVLARRLNPIRAQRFRPVALWSGAVRCDAQGEARIAFDVPEFTGELRLMAVAVNRSASGSASRAATVKRPLVVQPSLPRFLAPGDQCLMGAQIFNETGADQRIRVAVTTEGPLSVGSFDREFALARGGERSLRVPLVAGTAPGKAICRIAVEAGEERYAEEIELAVRPAAPPATVIRDGALVEGEAADLAPPSGWLPGTVEVEAWCGVEPEIALGGALDYLLRYPYGCLEQTISSAFPLLYFADLVNRARPAALGNMETEHFARSALWRVLGMQQAHGGFALWPNGETYDWGSVYAAHFLVEAARAGIEAPAERRDAALDFLRDLLRRAAPPDADTPEWREDRVRRAYACQVLALAGRPDHGWNARLLETADRLSASARAHLASALILAGRPREATALLDHAPAVAAAERHSGGNLDSPARDLALELAARVEVDPADPRAAQLALRLSGRRAGGAWHTTQENAVALMALGKYYRARPARPAPFAAALRVDGRETPFTHERIFRWTGAPSPRGVARIENRGPGPLLYYVRLHGVPADGRVEEADHGLRVRRQVLDLEGVPLARSRWTPGDAAVIRIVLDPLDGAFDNIVIEDLLPAGLEIENPALTTSETTPWIRERIEWVRRRELRDDRLLLFTGRIAQPREFHYTVRAVTPGRFAWPAIQASAMYDPAVRSAGGAGWLDVSGEE